MGLLDDLKKQAESVKTQENFQQNMRDENLRVVDDKMKQTFQYLNELLKQLAVLKPTNPVIYSIPGVADLKNLAYSESFIDYRRKRLAERDCFESISFYINWKSGEKIVVDRDMPATAQKIRDALFTNRLKFSEEEVKGQRGVAAVWRFTLQSEIVTDVTAKADYDQRRLLFTGKNLMRLGVDEFAVPADDVNEALLEEFAKILLGQPSGFRKYRGVATGIR